MTTASQPDLTIRGEAVERVYDNYTARRFLVNRRYQRKLIWTIDEKRSLIDSLVRGYPLPLILLGDVEVKGDRFLEIIDGMQRLDAIFSFLENRFALNGKFFDLDTTAETKLRKDKGLLIQQEPRLDREACKVIAAYSMPLSQYRSPTLEQIDDIFRRINSGGQQLSKHDLRQAGTTSQFASVVRRIAARIRGDVSHRDMLALNDMQTISITSKDLDYGIDIEHIYWVEQNILTRDYVRKSRDEELIADILAFMALKDPPASSSEILDEYFGLAEDGDKNFRFQQIEEAVKRNTAELLERQFLIIHDTIRNVLSAARKKFNQLMFADAGQRVPRYYQAVFLAFYKLMIQQNMRLTNASLVIKKLDGIGEKFVDVGGGGGRWSSEQRVSNVDAVLGVVQSAFSKAKASDPALDSWTTELENLLTQSFTEQTSFDFKQGLFPIAKGATPSDGVIGKVTKTLAAMANAGPGEVGYVIVGIPDNDKDVATIEATFGVKPHVFGRFKITGVEHEAISALKNIDSYYRWVVQKLGSQPIPPSLKDQVTGDMRLVRYFDKSVLVLRVVGGSEPVSFDGKFYIRKGANVTEVDAGGMTPLFRRFLK